MNRFYMTKRFLGTLPKATMGVITAVVMTVSMVSVAGASFSSRPTKVWTDGTDGFDHVTFNSFTGVPKGIGDERDFFRGVQEGVDASWTDPVNNVKQDGVVQGKIYIHNNADARMNDTFGNPGVAKNVTVRVALPTDSKPAQDATAYIKADNANPGEISDTLSVTGANNGHFDLSLIPGSVQLHKAGAVTTLTTAQEQQLMGNGLNLGDQKGCFDYVQEVTFRMQVKMPEYKITKSVRFDGQTSNDWRKSLDAKLGQTVEWKLEFDNTGRTLLNTVDIIDEIPAHLTIVPGSVKLVDGNFPNGTALNSDTIQKDGKQVHVNIGNVNPGINSIIAFKTKINDDKDTQCGTTKLENSAFATPKGYSPVTDSAVVNVVSDKACATPTPNPTPTPVTVVKAAALPNTGAGDMLGVFGGVSAFGAALHTVVSRRRLGRK